MNLISLNKSAVCSLKKIDLNNSPFLIQFSAGVPRVYDHKFTFLHFIFGNDFKAISIGEFLDELRSNPTWDENVTHICQSGFVLAADSIAQACLNFKNKTKIYKIIIKGCSYLEFNLTLPLRQVVSWKNILCVVFGVNPLAIMSSKKSMFLVKCEKHCFCFAISMAVNFFGISFLSLKKINNNNLG